MDMLCTDVVDLLLKGGGVIVASEEVTIPNGDTYELVSTNNTQNIFLLFCYSDTDNLEFSTDGQKWHILKHLVGTDYKLIIYPKMQFLVRNKTGADAVITASLWRANEGEEV